MRPRDELWSLLDRFRELYAHGGTDIERVEISIDAFDLFRRHEEARLWLREWVATHNSQTVKEYTMAKPRKRQSLISEGSIETSTDQPVDLPTASITMGHPLPRRVEIGKAVRLTVRGIPTRLEKHDDGSEHSISLKVTKVSTAPRGKKAGGN